MNTTARLADIAPVASPAYLCALRTVIRAQTMLDLDKLLTYRAWMGIAFRCHLHAMELKSACVVETAVTLPSGVTVTLPRWNDALARKNYLALRRLEGQARIMADVALITPDDRSVN